jgi:energy-coupling factor transporter ATP-binding protein EcfA2
MAPGILLFDEPTSALDLELAGEVLRTMRELAQERMTMLVKAGSKAMLNNPPRQCRKRNHKIRNLCPLSSKPHSPLFSRDRS